MFIKMNGFDERITVPCHDDIEFAHRLKKIINEIFFLKSAIVYHPWYLLKSRKKIRMLKIGLNKYLDIHPEEMVHFKLTTLTKIFIGSLLNTKKELINFKGKGFIGKYQFLVAQYLTQININLKRRVSKKLYRIKN